MCGNESPSETIPVGECENCGYVYGDELYESFPSAPSCPECGENIEETKKVPVDRLREWVDSDTEINGGEPE